MPYYAKVKYFSVEIIIYIINIIAKLENNSFEIYICLIILCDNLHKLLRFFVLAICSVHKYTYLGYETSRKSCVIFFKWH